MSATDPEDLDEEWMDAVDERLSMAELTLEYLRDKIKRQLLDDES